MCSCCMSREKCKGDRKLRCWHPFKLPEHGFRETEDWKVLPRKEETENLSVAGAVVLLFGGSGRLKFSVTLPVLLLGSNTQLTFQARLTNGTHT